MTAENSRPGRDTGTADEQRGDDAQGKYGAACPDCAAPPCAAHQGQHHHEPTCPLGRALAKVERKDLRWFSDRPRATARRRPATPAEATSVELSTGFRPTHVHVTPGRGREWDLCYGYADAESVRVMSFVVAGGGRHG